MDLDTVTEIRTPRTREQIRLGPDDAVLAGGTWLFSQPQRHLRGLVDLTTLDWPAVEETADGLSVGATCTFAQLSAYAGTASRPTMPLFSECCASLYGSFKVAAVATVGGNICLALPAGPMTALTVALDATALVWMPDGGQRTLPVLDLVVGPSRTSLAPGEILRSVLLPAATLESRTAYRKESLTPLGRSAALVVGRLDDDGTFVLTVTASTPRPVQLRFPAVPAKNELADAVRAIDDWYDDVHGAPDWRAHLTVHLAEQIRSELGS